MLLEERRSVFLHIVLNILTLGLYGLYATADIARDTNVVCYGDGKKSVFGIKEMLFSVLTLGIYQAIFMRSIISRWNAFIIKNKRSGYINSTAYLICRLSVFASFVGLSACYKTLGELCEDFNDSFFRMDVEGGISERFIREQERITAEREEREKKAAGFDIIEEYNFENDRRRVDGSAEYAARLALLEELEQEKRREMQEQLAKEAEAEEALEKEKRLAAKRAHRNTPWFLRVFICALVLFLVPMIGIISVALSPSVYGETFVGELGEKYALLNNTEEKKIVVIGGSSVAFGLDSKMMEEHLGMKVVNFGLYADLGTKIMMDLSKTNINKGDIVIIAPELNSQTLSLYFNAETTIQALDGNWQMMKNIDTGDYESLIGASWRFAGDKLEYLLTGVRPGENVDGAYQKKWFNEYGDNVYDRPYNTMKNTPKSIKLDFMTNSADGLTSDYESFLEYVNDYTSYCDRRGATVYFSFAPMNSAAMDDYNTAENIYSFYKNLRAALDCRVISDINQYIMDEGYFFDSEFHLNNAGVTVRTVQLIDDIKRELGISTVTVAKEDLPEPPGYAPIDTVGGDQENLYFILESEEVNGTQVWSIAGLNENGMAQETLEIPNNVDGIPVIRVKANAFAGSLVKTLYLGENISVLDKYAFANATELASVYVPYSKTSPDQISVPNGMGDGVLATTGASQSLRIYINKKAVQAFKADYYWDAYSDILVGYTK